MQAFAFVEDLGSVRQQIRGVPKLMESKPERATAIARFGERVRHAAQLVVAEPEIAAFALLQWVAVMLVYGLWSWGVESVPEEITYALWSLACLAAAALPIGFFAACIGAVHFLRRAGKRSTLPACVALVLPQIWPLWAFHLLDAGFTGWQMLDRVPGRRPRPVATRAASEALYYAWKLGTVGILPSLLAGRSLRKAADESADLVRQRLAQAALLRIGYSSACWIVGLGAYAATLGSLHAYDPLVPATAGGGFWLVTPVVVALAFVQLLARPVYVLACCDLYHDYRGHRRPAAGMARDPAPVERTGARGDETRWEAFGRSPAVRAAAAVLVALGAWAAYEFGDARPVTELKGVRLGQTLAEATESVGSFDYEPRPGPDLGYLQRNGRVRLAVRDGLVRGISYQCNAADSSRLRGVACHDDTGRIGAAFGEGVRVLCAQPGADDPSRGEAPFMRVHDVVDAGIRYVVAHGKVSGFIVREPSDLLAQVGGDHLWHPCKAS